MRAKIILELLGGHFLLEVGAFVVIDLTDKGMMKIINLKGEVNYYEL